jgi:hypothetical protein
MWIRLWWSAFRGFWRGLGGGFIGCRNRWGEGVYSRHYSINYYYIFGHPPGQVEFARDVRVSWKLLDSSLHTL